RGPVRRRGAGAEGHRLTMILDFEDRLSDSPLVETIWRSRSERGGPFVSIAQTHFEMAVTRHRGLTFITLRGPETRATPADGPAEARSIRSAQRHFLRATGIPHGTVRQIERARRATLLLRDGVPILDVVHDAGYYDQAHLTRSLRRFVGQTPAAVSRMTEQLS